MNQRDDCLIEILTEELPPKSLSMLSLAFMQQIKERLLKAELEFDDVVPFATPRRLAVLVKRLSAGTREQMVDRKGPALQSAYDAAGKPTPACVGFARSCGIEPQALQIIKTDQGEWVGYQQKVAGKKISELLPTIVEQAAMALPIPKRMRWGALDAQFVRPVQSVILLYGDQVIEANLFACQSGRVTRGHRFHAPASISIPHASKYEALLESEGHVIASFAKRRQMIVDLAKACEPRVCVTDDALLDEVTGLVEWPVALKGSFDSAFLNLPSEVPISSMRDHQRYFPVMDAGGKLQAYFVAISNIDSRDSSRVVHGNERVLRARLSDAAFFYNEDKHESLEQRLERLKHIVFQAKLGTLHDKAQRMRRIAAHLAEKLHLDVKSAARAGLLAKADLTTSMVNEFPELQGIMGAYYAEHDHETAIVASGIREQYLPNYSGGNLPVTDIGRLVSLSDRLDTIVGTFGINQLPTGDKDPYGLRRAALGVLRILIENQIHLNLKETLDFVIGTYTVPLENKLVKDQVWVFMKERLRAWYQEQGVEPDVFSAVAAIDLGDPLDMHQRVKAVQAFKKLPEAAALCAANKRVSNILSKYTETIQVNDINPALFEGEQERELARQLDEKSVAAKRLFDASHYDQALLLLAGLRGVVDDFFEHVMVMSEDKSRRENRLLLLVKLRSLFLEVADIALLQ